VFSNVPRMPELRYDAIGGQAVIVAVERAARPFTVAPAEDSLSVPSDCPFCAERETMTPPEVHRIGEGEPDSPGWRVRVVPNLYPIVAPAPAEHASSDHSRGGTVTPATGAHEVVVLSPDHHASFGRLDDTAATEVLTVIRDRVRHHLGDGHSYVQAFVNQGRAAGASIAHPHAQIVALDLVPPAVESGVERFIAARVDLVARELSDARRDALVVVDGPALAWSPFAAGSPYAMRVAHRSTRARFDDATDAEVRVVAIALRDALAALHALLGEPAYNVVVRTAPPALPAGEFHWYLDIVPRIGVVAGFEQGTGILVNVTPPEQAAAQLREAAGR
jgi:UDPglucose--hexose-1-phosphate uridylyltransferase